MTTPVGPYTPVVSVDIAQTLVYTSGQIGIRDGQLVQGGLEAELRQVFQNLRSVLEQGDASLEQVFKTTVFMLDMAEYSTMNTIYMEELGDHRPARSAVAVAELPLGAKVEIEAIAAI